MDLFSLPAPFIAVAVIVVLYYTGSPRRQAALKRDLNFYLVCLLITTVVSIIAGSSLGRSWLDYLAWIVAAVAILVMAWRFKTSPLGEESKTEVGRGGPLESSSGRKP